MATAIPSSTIILDFCSLLVWSVWQKYRYWDMVNPKKNELLSIKSPSSMNMLFMTFIEITSDIACKVFSGRVPRRERKKTERLL